MTTQQTIIEVLEEKGNSKRVITDLSAPRSVWVSNKKIAGNICEAAILPPKQEIVLDDFWKDVMSRNGMDVCTPFINRFKGHSFVAYDNGLVWSKSMKIGFDLSEKGKCISMHEMPKGMKKLYGIGCDLTELNKK